MKQKLSQWAKEHNYTYQGAYLAFKAGRKTEKLIQELNDQTFD